MSTLRVNSIIPTTGVPAGGGGGIVQMIQYPSEDDYPGGSQMITTSTIDAGGSTWTPTTLEQSISPVAAGSKILIEVQTSFYQEVDDNTAGLTLYRSINGGSYTSLTSSPWGLRPIFTMTAGGAGDWQHMACMSYIDTPGHSAHQKITYKVYYKSDKANNKLNGTRTGTQLIQLFEVSA
jgi:hypothetical protein